MKKVVTTCPHCATKVFVTKLANDGSFASMEPLIKFLMRGAEPGDLTKARIECGNCSTMFPVEARLLNIAGFTPPTGGS